MEEVGTVIGKNTTLEVPPPGLGLTTVIEPVLAVAMSKAVMTAVNCEPFTKVVVRALQFQFTTEPETKPVPFTVSVNPGPPGAAASGTSGWLTYGTGFAASAFAALSSINELVTKNAAIAVPQSTRRCCKGIRLFTLTSPFFR
jgi:hypothetical protein